MPEDDIVRLTLLFSALAAVFGGLTVFKPLLKAIWRHWLRFWWYRVMVALREDRSHHMLLDLPEGIKGTVRLVLHPVRRWHPKTPTHETRIQKYAACPFYHPLRCVTASSRSELNLSCYPDDAACHSLGFDPNQVPSHRHRRLSGIVRGRPSSKRAIQFALNMLSKMQPTDGNGGGSRIAIVFNGSPLFTGDAGSGESNIRQWIIENDWLETIVALPDQMFYNTGISTYIWILTNRKEPHRVGKVQLIDGRQFFTKMRKSLGNKRHELSQAQIDDLTSIHGNFSHGETYDLTDEDPVTHLPRTRPRVVSKVFDNRDFGFQKITVERPLRLNFAASPERIARLEDEKAFINLAKSKKRAGPQHDAEVAAGESRQELIRALLAALADEMDGEVVDDRDTFLGLLSGIETTAGVRLATAERKAVVSALSERSPGAAICQDRNGNPEPDPQLRDTETVPLDDDVDDYMAREVLLHIPDAWVDHAKTKTGYEIPLNRHFYVYEPPRPLDEIDADLHDLEDDIIGLLADVTS